MLPTEEERTKIQEAQMKLPDVPLAHAEQFLLTLATINELTPRLNLWAFKLDYDANEKEAAESLSDLKHTVDQIKRSTTLKKILATLLAIGNFLNGIKVNLPYSQHVFSSRSFGLLRAEGKSCAYHLILKYNLKTW